MSKENYSDEYKKYMEYTDEAKKYAQAYYGLNNEGEGGYDDGSKGYYDLAKQYIDEYAGRDGFSYDVNTDKFYQQQADEYKKNANMAMKDTMARAAGLTGGYGSSYAGSAGAAAYSETMKGLDDVALALYEDAYDKYTAEGQDMLAKASLYQGLGDKARQDTYAKYEGAQTLADNYLLDSEEYRRGQFYDSITDEDYKAYVDSGATESFADWMKTEEVKKPKAQNDVSLVRSENGYFEGDNVKLKIDGFTYRVQVGKRADADAVAKLKANAANATEGTAVTYGGTLYMYLDGEWREIEGRTNTKRKDWDSVVSKLGLNG